MQPRSHPRVCTPCGCVPGLYWPRPLGLNCVPVRRTWFQLRVAPPWFFLGGGYCSPGKYVYVHAVAMYILLSVDNVLIQMNWREMAICLIQLI